MFSSNNSICLSHDHDFWWNIYAQWQKTSFSFRTFKLFALDMSNGDPDLFSDQIGIKICFYFKHILDGLFWNDSLIQRVDGLTLMSIKCLCILLFRKLIYCIIVCINGIFWLAAIFGIHVYLLIRDVFGAKYSRVD